MPLLFDSRGSLKIDVLETGLDQLRDLASEPDTRRLFLVQAGKEALDGILKSLKGSSGLMKHSFIFILPEKDFRAMRSKLSLLGRAFVIADSIRPEHLRLMVELLLEREHYHRLLRELSSDARKQSRAFEQVLELARRELSDARQESEALKALLEYEGDIRKAQQEIDLALERAAEYRDQELKETKEMAKATEKALEFSLRENMDREQMLVAMERLRGLSDQELLELYKENQELRKKLGLPESQS